MDEWFFIDSNMRLWTIITRTIWAWVIAGWACLTLYEEQKHEWAKVLTESASLRTQSIIARSWDTEISEAPGNWKATIQYENPRDLLSELLEKNLILKQRIQGTTWYRDFVLWRIPREVAETYFRDASFIEQVLSTNPWMLEKIQYEPWWQKYIRWDMSPPDMLSWNIQAFLDIQKIQKEHPDLYEKAQQNPTWSQGIQQGEDHVVVGQRDFLLSLQLRLQYLSQNPGIEERVKEKGFTRNNLFTDDWSKWEWIYGFLNSLQDWE